MILALFWALFIISLSLIGLGVIYSKEWSGVAIVGFTFLFLLSYTILTGSLAIEKGSNVTSSYVANANGTITASTQQILYIYDDWNDVNSHRIGLFMAIISGIGTFGSVLNTLHANWRGRK